MEKQPVPAPADENVSLRYDPVEWEQRVAEARQRRAIVLNQKRNEHCEITNSGRTKQKKLSAGSTVQPGQQDHAQSPETTGTFTPVTRSIPSTGGKTSPDPSRPDFAPTVALMAGSGSHADQSEQSPGEVAKPRSLFPGVGTIAMFASGLGLGIVAVLVFFTPSAPEETVTRPLLIAAIDGWDTTAGTGTAEISDAVPAYPAISEVDISPAPIVRNEAPEKILSVPVIHSEPTEEPIQASLKISEAPVPPEETPAAADSVAEIADTVIRVHVPTGATDGDSIVLALRNAGYRAEGPIPTPVTVSRSNARFFYDEDAVRISDLVQALESQLASPPEPRDFTHLPARPARGTVELWIAGAAGSETGPDNTGTPGVNQTRIRALVNAAITSDQ